MLPHGRFVDAGEGDCGGPGNRVSGGAGMPTAQLRPDRQFDIHIEQSFLDIVHREGTIDDDGLIVRRADVGDEPFDVVERDLFGAARQYTYAVAETVVVFP